MNSCFGYIRVSTVKQGEGASLEAQKDAITGFASQNGIEIVKWFEELETASKAGRPLFRDMLSELRKGKADGVVIHRIDRSARNFSDWAKLDEVARRGVKVYFAADSLDFDTRGGRLLADIQMALAADYSRNLSIEAKKGLYGRLKQGIYPFRAPIGYLDNGGGKLKTIDPVKAPLVKELFRLYLTGDYSITSLTVEMQRRGLKGNGARPVVRRNVATILNLPFYCGQMRVLDKLYDGKHERLISVADWRTIQRIKDNRYAKKTTKHGHLFRGLINCGDCQRILTGEKQKGRVYYRCHTKNCPGKGMREDRLETAILRKLKQLEISEKDRVTLEVEMRAWNEGNKRKGIAKSLRLRIAEAKSKQDRLTDLLVDGAINKEAFALRKDNLTFEIGQLQEELAGIEKQRLSEVEMAEVMELLMSISMVYQKTDPAHKRQLLKNVFEVVSVDAGVLAFKVSEWFLAFSKDGCGVSRREIDQIQVDKLHGAHMLD